MSAFRGARGQLRRAGIIVAVALGLLIAAIAGPNLASAGPFRIDQDANFGKAGPGWIASNNQVNITAPTARVYKIYKVTNWAPVRRSNGTMSPPDTVFLQVRKLEFDDIKIQSFRPDHTWLMANPNGKDRSSQLIIGNDDPNTRVNLWVNVNSLKLCLTPDTLNTLVMGYKGLFGGRLDEVLALIQKVFEPYLAGPLKNVGPCIPLKELLPLLQVIVDANVPLPEMLPAIKLDIDANAAQVKTRVDLPSVRGPVVMVRMFQ